MAPPCDGTVHIVEDDPSVRAALTRLLEAIGCRVVAVGSVEEFRPPDPGDGPACLLLDVRLPGQSGLVLQARLAGTGLPIVFLTGHGDVAMAVAAMKDGATDFLTKPVDEVDLLRAVQRGFAVHRRVLAESSDSTRARRCLAALTGREREVMRHVITGLPNKSVAAELGISIKTVKIHRGRVMQKMGADSVVDLVRLANLAGISPASGYDQRTQAKG